MISWTKLLVGKSAAGDGLRYSCNHNCIPKIVVWNITNRCNLYCQHCYSDAKSSPDFDQLGKEEAQNFINDLAESKVAVLLFSGGEPLLRKDVFELGRYAVARGLKAILSTNGTLITPVVAKRIKAAGFSYTGISLDGMEVTNDTFRKNKGAFRASLEGIRNCKNQGLRVGVRFTLSKYNFLELPALFELVEKELISRFCIYHLVYSGRGEQLLGQDLSHEQRREALELIWQKTFNFHRKGLDTEILTVDNHADGVWIYLKMKKKDPARAEKILDLLKSQGGNSSGVNIAAVDNQGNIYPDQFWKIHCLGNVREKKLSDVWQAKEGSFLEALRNRKFFLKGACRSCRFLQICNGNFRARAEAVSNDPWGEDPACYLTKDELSVHC